MTQQDLADALGISQQRVSSLARQGMPTESVDAARRWRERNVDRSRGHRSRGRYYPPRESKPPPATPTRIPRGYGAHWWAGWWVGQHPGDVDLCLDTIHALGRQVKQYGDAWLEPLRRAMLYAPPLIWEAVDFDKALWVKLTGDPTVIKTRRGDGPFTAEMARRYIAACDLPAALERDYVESVEGA